MLKSMLRILFLALILVCTVMAGHDLWTYWQDSSPAQQEADQSNADSAPASAPAPALAPHVTGPGLAKKPALLPDPAPAAAPPHLAGPPDPADAADAANRAGSDAATSLQPLVPPAQSLPPAGEDENPSEEVIQGTLDKGDTVSKVLGLHASVNEVQKYIDATREVFPPTAFRAGQPYVVVCDVRSGSVKRFEYEIDRSRRLVVEGETGAPPVARVEAIEYEVRLNLVEGRIEDNLFQAVADLGESPQMALLIANLFGWEINFIRDLKEGDAFSFLVEKQYREGQFKGYGRTLGATFTNKGKTYEAFLFHDSRGKENHYNIRGENLKKVLLQAPLSFTRVTSGYTRSRKHPIFGDHRAHFGVDYGAPSGTPVKAVGDGTVSKRGWAGGYGNQIIVRHVAGLESMYSHLSGFARGIARGSKVRQGQVIGFVGSTGNSTGPHLDFRLKQNGNFINPTKAVNPRSESVGKISMRAFTERVNLVRGYMDGSQDLSQYNPELIAASVAAAAQSAAAVKQESKTQKSEKSTKKKKRRRSE